MKHVLKKGGLALAVLLALAACKGEGQSGRAAAPAASESAPAAASAASSAAAPDNSNASPEDKELLK